MGSVYKRTDSRVWWLAFTDAGGKRHLKSSGTEDRASAEKTLAALERRVRAERESGEDGPMTVARYAEKWLAARERRGLRSVPDDRHRLAHAIGRIGHLKLKDVRRQDVRDMVRALVEKGDLAPRSILHVYATLRVMFADAVIEELVSATPCTLKQRLGELPKKRDADPHWRAGAVFTRTEIEALISDVRIPEHRRVLYALLFLGGMRIGEATARRWRDWDRMVAPLGKLYVGTSYDTKRKEAREATKTGFVREVPVHPTLSKVLADWKLNGWFRYCRRAPTADDLIVPSPLDPADYMSATSALKRLHEDCARLNLRARRSHDMRRSFVTLGIADGGRKEILHWVSHGPSGSGEAFDMYLSLPWQTLCDEVRKINVRLREGELVTLSPRYGTATETE
jgi:integrase